MELGQKDKIQRDYSRIQANTAIGSQEVVEAQVHQASSSGSCTSKRRSKRKASPLAPTPLRSSKAELKTTKAKSSLSTKLSWPVRVQKALYTVATCCVKCLGPV